MLKIGVTIKIRNFCMNNSVEALILFSERHQGLLKPHVHLGGGGPGWGGRGLWAVFCCIASGKSIVSRLPVQKFDIWYLKLKDNPIETT